MIGLDVNVLVRYFVDDDEIQHWQSRELIYQNSIFLSNIVLVEAYWVMQRLFKLEHKQLLSCFGCLLQMSNAHFENCEAFAGALHQCKTRRCDFADVFINRCHQLKGIITVSFDKKACATLGFVHPDSLIIRN